MGTEKHTTANPEGQAGAAVELHDAMPRPRRLPDDDPSPMQIEIYRGMTSGRRLEVAEQLYWSARRMKWAWLRAQHSDWTDAQVEAAVTRNFRHARS